MKKCLSNLIWKLYIKLFYREIFSGTDRDGDSALIEKKSQNKHIL